MTITTAMWVAGVAGAFVSAGVTALFGVVMDRSPREFLIVMLAGLVGGWGTIFLVHALK